MKTRQIPTTSDPFVVVIGTKVFSYKAGITTNVPDEVAKIIDNMRALSPKAVPLAKQGTVLTANGDGTADFRDGEKEIPASGTVGYVLTKTATGFAWQAIPTASETAKGMVKKAAAVAPATSSEDVVTQFNALVSSLVSAGIISEYVAPST